jgi:hypothetical protein
VLKHAVENTRHGYAPTRQGCLSCIKLLNQAGAPPPATCRRDAEDYIAMRVTCSTYVIQHNSITQQLHNKPALLLALNDNPLYSCCAGNGRSGGGSRANTNHQVRACCPQLLPQTSQRRQQHCGSSSRRGTIGK